MPAKSKQQQKFMGIVRAIQKGDEPASKFSKAAQDAADDMKQKDVEDFASTKHKGLPKKVEQYLRQKIRKEITQMIREDWWDRLSKDEKEKYVKAHPNSKKAKQHAWDKKRDKRAAKISSPNYTIDGDGNIIKVKKLSKSEKAKEEKRRAKHVAAIKKGYFPGDAEYDKFMKEDYVETCGYTQSVDGKKLKTPGATGEEDRHLKEGLPTKIKDLKKVKKIKDEPDWQKGTFNSIETFSKHHAGSMGAGDMGRIAEPDTYDWDDSGSEPNPAGHQTKKNKKKKGWEPVGESIEEAVKEAKRITRGNRGVKVGDTVKFYDRDRNPAHYRGKVKWIMKAKKNKEFVDFIYITAKGNYTDQHLQGTKAYKWHYRRRESVNENILTKQLSKMINEPESSIVKFMKKTGLDEASLLDFVEKLTRNSSSKRKKHIKILKLALKGNKKAEKFIMKTLYGESVNEGSLNWEKNFPGFNKQEYRVIQRLIAMNSKHIDGEIRQYKKNPKAYKRMIKKFLKRFPRLRRESVNEIRNKREAETLVQQLGGNKFKMMVGAKNFGIDGKSLTFKIGRNSKGVNYVRIKLTSRDLYDIEFIQLRAGKVKIKSKAKDVYADQLGKMFKKHTGMNVRLFRETINEASVSQVRSIVKRVKKQLMKKWAKKGGYENFGQKELRKLKDKLHYNPYGSPQERQISKMLDAFNNWAMNYSGDMRESRNEAPKNYDRAMKKMLDFMKKSAYKQYKKSFDTYIEMNTWEYPKLLKKGRTFDKIVSVRNNAPNKAQSANFFVHRETGDIYKAGSWSAPAKGRRGSIFEPNTYRRYDIHGGWLYKRR